MANYVSLEIAIWGKCTLWEMSKCWFIEENHNNSPLREAINIKHRHRRNVMSYHLYLLQIWPICGASCISWSPGGARGGRLTSLDASFMRCFGFFQTSSKTLRSMFFSKHRWNIASLSKKCDVLRDVLGLGPQRQKWLGPTILMPLWYNIACHASIFVNKLLE